MTEKEIEAKERELWITRRGISIAMQHKDIEFILEEVQKQNMQLHNFFNYGDVIHQLIEYYKTAESTISMLCEAINVVAEHECCDYGRTEAFEFAEKYKEKEERKDAK